MSATRTVWGKIRTAKVIAFNGKRECGVAVDVDNNEEIFFEMHRCRKVYARGDGNPFIGKDQFHKWPRNGNKILYIVDNRERIHDTEKKSAYVWGHKHFYLLSLQSQGGVMELEGALDGEITPETSAEPVRDNDNRRPKLVAAIGHILANLPQATLPTATAATVPEWSPGTPGLDTEGPAEESGEETLGDKSPEELAMAAGGCNGGKKSKPGQGQWIDGRGRKGRGCHQGWRRRH